MRWSLRRLTGPGAAAARAAAALAVLLCLAALAGGCGSDRRQVKLIYAGSLIVPFEKVAAAFEKEHPGVDVVTEAHGSIQVLRHVTELGDRMDLVASADEQLIPPLMYDRDDPATGEPWADWYCSFATNRMVLAVSPKSPLAGELTPETWYRRLTAAGRPLGPRRPALRRRRLPRADGPAARGARVRRPVSARGRAHGPLHPPDHRGARGTDADVIDVPEILETSSGSNIVLRGASIQLVALLESGDLDCAFEYESVARQHGLRVRRLRRRSTWATRVAATLPDRQREAGLPPLRQRPARVPGDVIRYALTIPANAPDPSWRGSSSRSCSGRTGGGS